jgi:hypothetical protein
MDTSRFPARARVSSSNLSYAPGEVAERLNAPVSKTGMGFSVHRGFESPPLRLSDESRHVSQVKSRLGRGALAYERAGRPKPPSWPPPWRHGGGTQANSRETGCSRPDNHTYRIAISRYDTIRRKRRRIAMRSSTLDLTAGERARRIRLHPDIPERISDPTDPRYGRDPAGGPNLPRGDATRRRPNRPGVRRAGQLTATCLQIPRSDVQPRREPRPHPRSVRMPGLRASRSGRGASSDRRQHAPDLLWRLRHLRHDRVD